MRLVAELLTFTASATLLADLSLLRPLRAKFEAERDHFLSASYGTQIEDGSTAYIMLGWDSIEGPNGVAANQTWVAEALTLLAPLSASGGPSIAALETDNDFAPAFNAPVTEITTMDTLKNGKTEADFDAAARKLVCAIEEAVPAGDVHLPIVYGGITPIYDEPRVYRMFIGWSSWQAREAAYNIKRVKKAANQLKSLFSDFETSHASFIQL